MHSKQELYSFTQKAYCFLKTHKGRIKLCKIRERAKYRGGSFEIAGSYNPVTDRIDIDYRVSVIGVLIHELLHIFHADWCETRIQREGEALINQLSRCQMVRLLKLFAEAAV